MSESIAYCRDKAAPDGSPGHYALLFQPAHARAGLLSLMALEAELREVVEDCSEPAVANHKLGWWREELMRTLEGNAAHPVCVSLSRHAPAALDAAGLETLLAGAARRINTAQLADDAAFSTDCEDTAGATGRLMAMLLPEREREDDLALAGVAVERVRLLSLPRRAGRPPHSGVPLTLLTQCGARPGDVDRASDDAATQRLRAGLMEGAANAVEDARSRVAPRTFAATRLALAARVLRAVRRGGYVAAGSAGTALPIAMLWDAWRCRP